MCGGGADVARGTYRLRVLFSDACVRGIEVQLLHVRDGCMLCVRTARLRAQGSGSARVRDVLRRD